MNLSTIVRLCLFGIACLGATLILGCLRRFPLGFAACLSIGAYVAACFRIGGNLPWAACVPLACAAAALLCAIPALADRMLEGDEYVVLSWMLAMGCAELIGLMRVTGGQHSLFGIPPLLGGPAGFSGSTAVLVVVFVVCTLIALAFRRTRAYEEACVAGINPRALSAAGGSPGRTTLYIHMVGGAVGGLAGAFWGPLYQTLHPSLFGLSESVIIILVCLLGGQGEPAGVPVGLAVVFLAPQMLHLEYAVGPFAALSQWLGVTPPDPSVVVSALSQALLGALLVATIVWLRRGIVPAVVGAIRKRYSG